MNVRDSGQSGAVGDNGAPARTYSDGTAWVRQALDEFEGPLVRYARSITRDLHRARDCVQETFLRLCRTDRAQLDGRLAAWLFSVCRNLALDVHRKENRMSAMSAAVEQRLPARESEPASAAEQSDAAGAALRCMSLLPENQREVLRLKFQNELSYKEIAGVTGHSVSNVGLLIHRGLKTLRSQMAGSG